MELKEKVKAARLDAQKTQKQLAKEVGVSLRTIQFYESGERTPQNAAIILRLAKALNVKTDYFLSNDELEQMQAQDAFLDEAKKHYGTRGKSQAQKLLEQTSALFAGGDLSEEDREAFFETVTEIYFDAKKRAKKYAHKKCPSRFRHFPQREAKRVQDYILEQARRLTKQYGTRDPFELIDALHIHLMIQDSLGGLKGFYYTLCRERYIVVNGRMNERNQLLVAAHELGHDRLHRKLARVSPLKDFAFYDVTSHTEYEANLFASELLVSDEDVEECIEEGMDYLSMCRTLGFHPQLMSFKLYGMVQRGFHLNLPEGLDSRFLGK